MQLPWLFCCHLIISGNQLWSCQKGMTMTSSPSLFISLPRASCIMFESGKTHFRLSGHSFFRVSPPKVFLSERSTLKYHITLNVLLLTNKSTTGFLYCLNSLWKTGSLDSTLGLPSLLTVNLLSDLLQLEVLWTDCYSLLVACEQYFPHITIQFLAMGANLHHQIGHCCYAVYLEGDYFPLDFLSLNCGHAFQAFSSSRKLI